MKPFLELRKALLDAGAHYFEPHEVNREDDGGGGCWQVSRMRVLASWGGGWDHVSVSAGWTKTGATRIPTYGELEVVRRMFWHDHETVIQIHPPIAKYVNCHPHVLHLWRPQGVEIPLPPQEFIA
jgi:hypothetical protein